MYVDEPESTSTSISVLDSGTVATSESIASKPLMNNIGTAPYMHDSRTLAVGSSGSTDYSSAGSACSTSALMECDIGKLMEAHTGLHQLSQENKYRIVTMQLDSDTSSYPRTHPCESSAFRHFQPSWLKQYPGFITVDM